MQWPRGSFSLGVRREGPEAAAPGVDALLSGDSLFLHTLSFEFHWKAENLFNLSAGVHMGCCADLIFTLHFVHTCSDHQLPSDEAVKRVLAGEKGHEKGRTSLTSKSQALNNRDVRGNEPGHKDKEVSCPLHIFEDKIMSLSVAQLKTFLAETLPFFRRGETLT